MSLLRVMFYCKYFYSTENIKIILTLLVSQMYFIDIDLYLIDIDIEGWLLVVYKVV